LQPPEHSTEVQEDNKALKQAEKKTTPLQKRSQEIKWSKQIL
jgi:hypothetical protein